MAFSPAFLDELVARNPIEDVVGQYVSLTRRAATCSACVHSTLKRRPLSPLLRTRGSTIALAATRAAVSSILLWNRSHWNFRTPSGF